MKSSDSSLKILIGQYDVKIGAKHQLAFPKKYRSVLGEHLIITKGIGNYLIVISSSQSEILLEGTDGKPFTDRNTREFQRYLLGNAIDVALDTQGRFVIPEYLRSHAKITDEVVCVGVRNYVEVWDKESWERHQEELSRMAVDITERITEYDRRTS